MKTSKNSGVLRANRPGYDRCTMRGAGVHKAQQRKAGEAHFKSTRINLCDSSNNSPRAKIQLIQISRLGSASTARAKPNPKTDRAQLFYCTGQAVGGVLTTRASAAASNASEETVGPLPPRGKRAGDGPASKRKRRTYAACSKRLFGSVRESSRLSARSQPRFEQELAQVL